MRYLIWLVFVIVFISGCKKDESNPVSSSTSIEGTWKTNGIYEYIPNYGVELILLFSNNSYEISSHDFEKDTSSNNWIEVNSGSKQKGTYIAENNFLRFTLQNGTMGDDGMIWHYKIDGNKLTLNSAWDWGGIFNGNSNILTNSVWTIHYSYYDSATNSFNNSLRNLIYNPNQTGMEIYKSFHYNYTDTLLFTYTINGDELTHNFQTGYVYKGIYKIIDNKLYIYGKPGTSDNDDYYMFELFR